ncbi:MAG: hypothetical protein WA655_03015 [Candidatus Korobacteraceae bacterium]
MNKESTQALLDYLKELTLRCVKDFEKTAALEAAIRKHPELAKDYPQAIPPTSEVRGVWLSKIEELYTSLLHDQK